jgi:chemotaxis protein MotA
MFSLIGILVVIVAIVGGYLMEHGHLAVLIQPAEWLIICGAAVGTVLIANPLPTIVKLYKGILGAVKGSRHTRALYLETLKMLNALFISARKNGATKLEADIEEPHKSDVFKKFPGFLAEHEAVDFLCDTLRMSITGQMDPFALDQMMELDMEVHHHGLQAPITALSSVADSLPGLGIVAAVLGVVITMGSLGGPPEEIGHKVGAALVGTFLGILMCYGFLGPMASNMSKISDAEGAYYNVLRVGVIAYIKGNAPIICAEFARRAIPHDVRPGFKEMEQACKGKVAAPEAVPKIQHA